MAFLAPSSSAFFPPISGGLPSYYTLVADTTGIADATSALQTLVNAANAAGGGIVWCPTGTYLISSPITVPNNVQIIGAGVNFTIFLMSAAFSGAGLLSLSGVSFVTIANLSIVGASTTYSSNPAADGIHLSGVTDTLIELVEIDYINGFGVNSIGTSSIGNQKIKCQDIKAHLTAQGFHAQGVSGSNNVGLHQFLRCNASGIQNGDCYLIEDIHDIQMTDCGGEVTAGTGNSLHIKGVSGAVFCENPDFGPASLGNSPVALVEAGTNGSPKSVAITGGILEGGTQGLSVTSGGYVEAIGVRLYNNATYGVNASGGNVILVGCEFDGNGASGTNGRYDVRNNGTTHFLVDGCVFNSTQGAVAGTTNAVVNDISQTMVFTNNLIYGTGYTLTNYYNTQPLIDNNTRVGLLANGTSITPPAIGASPFTAPLKSNNYAIYLSGGTVSSVTIGGTATGQTSGLFILPSQQAIVVTYSVLPTWTWFRI